MVKWPYVTLDLVNAALLARAVNRIVDRPVTTTSDGDVPWRRWLIVEYGFPAAVNDHPGTCSGQNYSKLQRVVQL
jgi:hypothetical protein